MSDHAQFTVDGTDGFHVIVGDGVTVYEAYSDAVADIRGKLQDDADGFLAKVAIDGNGDTDDIAVTLEQVGWPQIIRDMEAPDADNEANRSSEVSADDED